MAIGIRRWQAVPRWQLRPGRVIGVAATLILHGLVFGSLWMSRSVPPPMPTRLPPQPVEFYPLDNLPPPPVRPQKIEPPPPLRPPDVRIPPTTVQPPMPLPVEPTPGPVEVIPVASFIADPPIGAPVVAAPVESAPVELRAGIDFRCPQLVYPRAARTAGEEGTVLLGLRLRHDGFLAAREVLRSSGSPRLDRAALGWVGRCSFSAPPTDAGTVEVVTRLPVVFQLR